MAEIFGSRNLCKIWQIQVTFTKVLPYNFYKNTVIFGLPTYGY